MFALRFGEEAYPKWIFESPHNGMVIGEKDFILVERFLLDGFAPGFRFFTKDSCLIFTVTVRCCVDP